MVFFFSGALFAKEYLLSYTYTVKDAVIFSEKLLISSAMTKCEGEPFDKSLTLPYPKSKQKENFRLIIRENFDQFLSYLSAIGFKIKENSQTINAQNTTTTRLIFPTTCFKVDFNDSFVTITAIK